MQVVPIGFKAHLRVMVDYPPQADASGMPDMGTVIADLSLQNTTHVPAQLPFLCITDLGLNIQPVPYGRLAKISADGRRLVRFSIESAAALRPGEKAAICRLTATWRARRAPIVSFDLGVGQPIEKLRDLKLFCISGAANFPSERSHLTIQAGAIREAVELQTGFQAGQLLAEPVMFAQEA